MEISFTTLNAKYQSIFRDIPPHLLSLWNDLMDSMEITSLRAKQIAAIYDYLDFTLPIEKREQRLTDAVNALTAAQLVIQRYCLHIYHLLYYTNSRSIKKMII
jgi:hypothetical protein